MRLFPRTFSLGIVLSLLEKVQAKNLGEYSSLEHKKRDVMDPFSSSTGESILIIMLPISWWAKASMTLQIALQRHLLGRMITHAHSSCNTQNNLQAFIEKFLGLLPRNINTYGRGPRLTIQKFGEKKPKGRRGVQILYAMLITADYLSADLQYA